MAAITRRVPYLRSAREGEDRVLSKRICSSGLIGVVADSEATNTDIVSQLTAIHG
jgi:hypothetical protein